MIITMFLSDIINNAATAVIMAPLAVSLADKINQPIEPFLMSVAIGEAAENSIKENRVVFMKEFNL